MNASPSTLDHAGIAARVPHHGSMCLLHAMLSWSASSIHCIATQHTDPDNPLRCGGVLLAPSAIEYAAQAMALHGALCAATNEPPSAGFLASARGVQLHVQRLDDIVGPLHIHASQLAGDSGQAIYHFVVGDEQQRPLVQGRATVVLNTPLTSPTIQQPSTGPSTP